MQIINELKDFFELDAIATAETFPELLQTLIYLFMACCILLFVFRAFFAMNAKISKADK